VGGGQEINRGEAGIRAWLEAVRDKYQHIVVNEDVEDTVDILERLVL
jgi:hypothetical protein